MSLQEDVGHAIMALNARDRSQLYLGLMFAVLLWTAALALSSGLAQ